MSSQEIVFWISLFGIDIGIPLMLPERWRFRTGLVMTGLSAVGLAWSLGYQRALIDHVGCRMAIVFVGVAALASMVGTLTREGQLSLWLYDLAERIQDSDLPRLRRAGSASLELHRAFTRYHPRGRLVANLIEEIVPFKANYRNSPYYKLVRSLRNPQTLEELADAVHQVNELASQVPNWRFLRFINDAVRGVIFGGLGFLIFRFVVVKLH